jgi:hypothetical protein
MQTTSQNCKGVRGVAALALAALSACYGEPPGVEPVEIDHRALLATIRTYDASPAFVRLNRDAYATALPSAALIDVYVNRQALAPYAAIVPESDGSGAIVPEGTMIVRAVHGDPGGPQTLTLMYKGPDGYNPDLGDYWFGVTDTSGAPKVENGVEQVGRLEQCYGCHAERAADDYLFGVPAFMRSHP